MNGVSQALPFQVQADPAHDDLVRSIHANRRGAGQARCIGATEVVIKDLAPNAPTTRKHVIDAAARDPAVPYLVARDIAAVACADTGGIANTPTVPDAAQREAAGKIDQCVFECDAGTAAEAGEPVHLGHGR